jgi:2,4-dienoyl-CoA reductase-like NADH-dependent reductase (Old Yellow Enzyme family)
LKTNLLTPFKLNDTIELQNRVLMAPLTRCMADDNLVPTSAMVEYYAKRADAGLIISEATIIRADGQGYPNTPGIYTKEQIEGWKKVTNAVHENGGKIFSQIWHVGRVAHPFFTNSDVLAPSAVAAEGSVPRMRDLEYQVPKVLTNEEIAILVKDYATAAKNAIEAGFDGVEIHGANGYLIDQFLHYESNTREDEYGQTPENMSRFALEVIDAVIEAIGSHKTALRLTPGAYFNMKEDNRDKAVFDYLLPLLESKKLAYLHGGIFDDAMRFDSLKGKNTSEFLREGYKGTLVGVGSYTYESANKAIDEQSFDLIAIGRPFIANPDYMKKIKNGEEIVEYTEEMLNELI